MSAHAYHEIVIPGGSEASEPGISRFRVRANARPGMTVLQLARQVTASSYFQSMILPVSPSNSMLQNAPPW